MLKNFSLKTPENTEELKELYKKTNSSITRRSKSLSTRRLMRSVRFRIDFYDFHDDCGNDAGTIRNRIFLVFPYRNRICRVGNLSRRVGYEEKLVWRKIDFPTVNLNVIACATATCLLYRQIYGYVALGVSIAIAIIVFALCLWKFNIFRNVSVISSLSSARLCLRHSSRHTSRR